MLLIIMGPPQRQPPSPDASTSSSSSTYHTYPADPASDLFLMPFLLEPVLATRVCRALLVNFIQALPEVLVVNELVAVTPPTQSYFKDFLSVFSIPLQVIMLLYHTRSMYAYFFL